MTDLRYSAGAVHDTLGPITSIVPETERGREWLTKEMDGLSAGGSVVIETSEAELVLACATDAGLVVTEA